MTMIITIDGPSGSGKGTLAAKLAQHYGYHLLDSGAIYRLLGLALHQANILNKLDNQLEQAITIAKQLDIEFKNTTEGVLTYLNGENVGHVIRTEQVGNYASQVAVIPELRTALLQRQKDFATGNGLVADGRDMGTVVFPDAQAKIYLTASAESRAQRRVKQLQNSGQNVNIDEVLAQIKERDKRDTERSTAPLKPASDAFIIDSSSLTIDEVFQKMVDYIQSRS